ncbi:MAG: PAS domain-containing protein [Burkholderiales bacterium]|nr:PAS domain-containing protein [Flavobacterium sp.]
MTNNQNFIARGGEMGMLTRAKNWDQTAVGPVAKWPQSLKTTLGIVLNSTFPMFLFWGPDLTCFYNDAYKPSLENEGKHPLVLGEKGDQALIETWNFIGPIIDQVLLGGDARCIEDQLLSIYRNGQIEAVYWTYCYSPVIGENGKISGVLVTCNETTAKVQSMQKISESEKRFCNTVRQIPLGVTILIGPEFIVEMVNETYLQLVDKTEQDLIGKPLFACLPEVKDVVLPLLTKVLKTGTAFHAKELSVMLHRYGKQERTYFNLVYYPLREDSGDIYGIIVVATEVTAAVKIKYALAESEKQFRNLVMQSPIPMAILRGEDYIIETANKVMFEVIWRRKENEVLGRKLLEVFPELNDQRYPQLLREMYLNGQNYKENETVSYVDGDDGVKKFYFDFIYTPLLDTEDIVSGIMVTVKDVTEQVEARKRVEDAEERLRLATEATELATWDLDLQTREIIHSPRLALIFGHKKSKKISHKQLQSQIHPADVHEVVEKAFDKAMKTSIYKYEARIIKHNLEICWIRTQGKVFFDEYGKPLKMLGTLRDITEEKFSQQILQESEQKFRLLADSMPQHIWTSTPQGQFNYFNKSVYQFSAMNEKQINEVGFIEIVHPDDRTENIKQWLHSIATGEDFIGEHRLRRHDGLYRWHLCRAIPKKDGDGNIQMWVGTSTDIEEQKLFTNELERQVKDRTAELEQKNSDLEKMNTELESFTYVSSHDLQEPLRKIQIFSNLLRDKESENLSQKGNEYLSRMRDAASRMQTLIKDLLAYSRTNFTERVFAITDLCELIKEVEMDFSEIIEEKGAVIYCNDLHELPVIPFQFKQLMFNLIGNALKFTKPGTKPFIQIIGQIVYGYPLGTEIVQPHKSYCHIKVTDNGIGFDSEYKTRIFEVFQRLHGKTEYAGTGIGLAIVKKIVDNHHGYITASSKPDHGATFDIYLPELNGL